MEGSVKVFGVWNKEGSISALHMSLINISGNHWKSWARLKERPLAPKQLGFYQPGVFPISLLVSVVCFGMHRSSLAQESFNYWTKLCHECIWKADAATSCQLALPRHGGKKERKSRDREESWDRGCPHYMKHLIQLKEIRLDFKETKNMASSKVKTYFCSPPLPLGWWRLWQLLLQQ